MKCLLRALCTASDSVLNAHVGVCVVFHPLHHNFSNVNQVHAEALGHCHATQRVVTDLRRSLAYIEACNSRPSTDAGHNSSSSTQQHFDAHQPQSSVPQEGLNSTQRAGRDSPSMMSARALGVPPALKTSVRPYLSVQSSSPTPAGIQMGRRPPTRVSSANPSPSTSKTYANAPPEIITPADYPQTQLREMPSSPMLSSSSPPLSVADGLEHHYQLRMPGLWRKALKLYEETLGQAVHAASQTSKETSDLFPSAHASSSFVTRGLSKSTTQAYETFTSRLHSLYQEAPSSSPFTGPSDSSYGSRAVDIQRRGVQCMFSAVVAAQTWILNALRQLAVARPGSGRPGATVPPPSPAEAMGISAEGLYRLLQDLRVARMQLSEEMDRLRAASEGGTMDLEGMAQSRGVIHGGPSSRPTAASSNHTGQQAASVEAAMRWRNRCLRAMMAQHVSSFPPRQGSGSRGLSAPPSGDHSGRGSLAPQEDPGSSREPFLDKPLGLWLPDVCWRELPDSYSQALSGDPDAPWWTLLLPLGACRAAVSPPRLHCLDVHQALAHGRAQQQLQHCLLQLHLEGRLAAPLVPPPAHTPSTDYQRHHNTRQGRQQSRPVSGIGALEGASEDESRLDRHIAGCRLAHLFLTTGAWNKRCCTVQLFEELGTLE